MRTWEFRKEDCTLRLDDLDALLTDRTRFVAFTHASNAVGTIPDVAGAIRRVRAQSPAALVFLDAVHYTPHNPIDVRALDCDFLGCSAYKFCGPHLGILYGKYAHLDRLEAYKGAAFVCEAAKQMGNRHAELRKHRGTARRVGVSGERGRTRRGRT